ncbi:hypothetical protein [Flavobacterium sp.]|uniref:hypothetical protein n=1 Tax=Flavobacterium sp. TaxID=239 RepID=UPI0026152F65|nr:hypothetical protein [Flavobacterium sp.]
MKNSSKTYFLFGKTAILLFAVTSLLLLLDYFTKLSINNIIIYFVLFYAAVTILPVIIAVDAFGFKSAGALQVICFSTFVICSLIAFFTWENDWKTQNIIYRSKENPAITIEYRMRMKRFAFGYQKQTVKKEMILPFIDLITETDTSKVDHSQWIWVDEKVNELDIPGDYEDL